MVPKILDQLDDDYQLAILCSPTEHQLEEIVFKLIKEDIVVYKSFRGKVDGGVHDKLKSLLNNVSENDYLCLKVSREVAEKIS